MPPARRAKARSPRRRLVLRAAGASGIVIVALLGWAMMARALAPAANTDRRSFDAIIVLGTAADSDGNPTPELMERISEGVREYQRGVAPRLIVTGAAVHSNFVEAEVMARVARAQGVPASQVIEEPQARDTIQNACYAGRIMQQHGWHSAEVVSSAAHLPRAALIFSSLSMQFRVHAAAEPLSSPAYQSAAAVAETLKTARYLAWARWTEPCQP